jgi:hypothetical protein
MNGKHKKLFTSLLCKFSGMMMPLVKKPVFPGGSSLLAQTYNSLGDVQKFITLRLFII